MPSRNRTYLITYILAQRSRRSISISGLHHWVTLDRRSCSVCQGGGTAVSRPGGHEEEDTIERTTGTKSIEELMEERAEES